MKNKFLENQKFLDEMDKFLTRLLLGLAIAFMLIVFFACGASKSSVKSDIDVSITDSSIEDLKAVSGSKTSLSGLSNVSNLYDIDFKLYDTDKPINPDTGKPPMLAEGTIKGTSNKESKVDINKNDSLTLSGNRVDTSCKEYKDKSETIVERKETTVPKQIGVLCAGVGLLVIVIWLLYKRFK